MVSPSLHLLRTALRVGVLSGLLAALVPVAVLAQFRSITVVEGDTLEQLAQRHGVSLEELIRLNGISEPELLQVGQVLKLPAASPVSAPAWS